MSRLLCLAFVLLGLVAAPRVVEAACGSSGTGFGNFQVLRTGGSCDCHFVMTEYTCANAGGVHDAVGTTTVATLSGDCNKDCRDISGYEGAAATAMEKWKAATDKYECDSTFVDADFDGVGQCLDADDLDPYQGVEKNGDETLCDGRDNDGDSSVDDGFGSACERDHKRLWGGDAVEGEGEDFVNLVEGSYIRREAPDAVVAGPFTSLVLQRTYNSRREDDVAGLGKGWSSSLVMFVEQRPSPDNRWMVELGDGSQELFRCKLISSDTVCAADDNRESGSLKKIGSTWTYWAGDGTILEFETSATAGRYPWKKRKNGAGHILAEVTSRDGTTGLPIKVQTANSALYLYLTYVSSKLDDVRLNSSSSSYKILDYDVVSGKLDKVKWASAVGSIDTNKNVYDGSSSNLETVNRYTTAVAAIDYDGSDRAISLQTARMKLGFTWLVESASTRVTYTIEAGLTTTSTFAHGGTWVKTRTGLGRLSAAPYATAVRDYQGRTTCSETDDSRMQRVLYTDSRLPTEIQVFGKSNDCTTEVVSPDHKIWQGWELNTTSGSWRNKWTRRSSIYSGAADCSGSSLPANCFEVKTEYVSSTDDRVQWVTQTGYTRMISGWIPQQVRKHRTYYFGLDTTPCNFTGDSYSGLAFRTETQDGSGTVFTRTDFTFYTSGLPKTVSLHDRTSDASLLTTTFASYNGFGSPQSVTSPSGQVTSYTFSGWNAVTQITETGALYNSTFPSPGTLSPVTAISYNHLRLPETVTLPKGNKLKSIWDTAAGGYARLKAHATADSSGNLLEILRLLYDDMGNVREERILDSISGTTPCADEGCSTYDQRRERGFNVLRQLTDAALYAADSADPPDGTMGYTYTSGQLTAATSFLGTQTTYTYNDLGRMATMSRDPSGLNVTTAFAYL